MRTLILSMLFLLPSISLAAGSVLTPDQTVAHYLQRDLNGARLTSAGWKDGIEPLVGWLEEPGWDVAVVVEAYQTQPVERAADGLRAVVTYRLLGELVAGQWRPLRQGPKQQQVNFLIDRLEGHWCLVRPVIPPHISVPTAIRVLEADAARYQSLEQQKVLQVSLRQLRLLEDQ